MPQQPRRAAHCKSSQQSNCRKQQNKIVLAKVKTDADGGNGTQRKGDQKKSMAMRQAFIPPHDHRAEPGQNPSDGEFGGDVRFADACARREQLFLRRGGKGWQVADWLPLRANRPSLSKASRACRISQKRRRAASSGMPNQRVIHY